MAPISLSHKGGRYWPYQYQSYQEERLLTTPIWLSYKEEQVLAIPILLSCQEQQLLISNGTDITVLPGGTVTNHTNITVLQGWGGGGGAHPILATAVFVLKKETIPTGHTNLFVPQDREEQFNSHTGILVLQAGTITSHTSLSYKEAQLLATHVSLSFKQEVTSHAHLFIQQVQGRSN